VGTNPEVEPLFISKNFPAKSWEISEKTPHKMLRLPLDAYGAGEGI